MASPVADLLGRLGRAFDSLSLPWYLFGAQAALLHGVARTTADVDVTVFLGPTWPEELVAALEAEGLLSRVPDDPTFVSRTRVVPMLDGSTSLPVDVVLAGPGLEELILEAAEPRQVEGITVPVPRAEHLVALKLLAGRAKDVEDVVALLAAGAGRLDHPALEALLGDLETALGQSDLLPAYRAALSRAGK